MVVIFFVLALACDTFNFAMSHFVMSHSDMSHSDMSHSDMSHSDMTHDRVKSAPW